MTISRVKFPWPPFFRIFIFFDEIFITVCETTYLMRDDGATVVKYAVVKSYLVLPKPYGPFSPPLSRARVCERESEKKEYRLLPYENCLMHVRTKLDTVMPRQIRPSKGWPWRGP